MDRFSKMPFGHETWTLGKVPEIAHTLFFYPRGSKVSLFLDTRRFSKLSYLGMKLDH